MKRGLVLALVLVATASCSSVMRWEKPGVGADQQRRDEAECSSLAARETAVPSVQGGGTTYGTPVAPQTSPVQPYDVGRFDDCMKGRGYQQVPARPPA